MQQHQPVGQRELQRDRDRYRDRDLPTGLAICGAFPRRRETQLAIRSRVLPFGVAGRFLGRDAVLELIQPAVQSAYALEYQRAFRGRVALPSWDPVRSSRAGSGGAGSFCSRVPGTAPSVAGPRRDDPLAGGVTTYRVSALSAVPAYSSAARQQYQAATER